VLSSRHYAGPGATRQTDGAEASGPKFAIALDQKSAAQEQHRVQGAVER
jgi:hypothetical protein